MLAPAELSRLRRCKLWPIRYTPAYYRRAAKLAPEELLRALLRLIADRVR